MNVFYKASKSKKYFFFFFFLGGGGGGGEAMVSAFCLLRIQI